MLDLRKEDLDAAIQRQLARSKERQDGQGRPAADQREVQMCARLHDAATPELTARAAPSHVATREPTPRCCPALLCLAWSCKHPGPILCR